MQVSARCCCKANAMRCNVVLSNVKKWRFFIEKKWRMKKRKAERETCNVDRLFSAHKAQLFRRSCFAFLHHISTLIFNESNGIRLFTYISSIRFNFFPHSASIWSRVHFLAHFYVQTVWIDIVSTSSSVVSCALSICRMVDGWRRGEKTEEKQQEDEVGRRALDTFNGES